MATTAQQKVAKEALQQAVTAYNCSKTIMNTSLSSGDAVNERTLNNKFAALKDALGKLNIAHTSWVSKAELEEDQLALEKYSPKWLEAEWTAVANIEDKLEDKLLDTSPPIQTNAQKLIVLRKQMQSLMYDIATNSENLLKITAGEVSAVQPYEVMLNTIKSKLSNDFNNLAEKVMSLETTTLDETCTEYENFRQKQLSSISMIQLQLAAKKQVPKIPESSAKTGIQMEKSRAPIFSGHTIDYPEFKRGWMKVAGAVWSDENQVEQIKFKVDAETRRIISRCTTMEKVWEVLDVEYAQEQEVINAVDEQLRILKTTAGTTSEYIVKLRNHLPNLEEALKGVNGLDFLCSADRVNFLVDRFDERTLYDWQYFRSKNKGTTYERFFDFLLDRYEAARSVIARQKSIAATNAFNEVRSPDSLMDQSVAVTALEPTECRRCQSWSARDKVYTCPGCGRGSQIGKRIHHCLEHCGAYMTMSTNERSLCVEKAKWCPVHLLESHTITDCKGTQDPRFVCGINNCQKHHHKTLHGSTTKFVATINATGHSHNTGENVLLTMQTVSTKWGTANSVFDNCATCCLVTKKAARRWNLRGEPIQFGMNTVSGKRVIDSCAYSITLIDNNKTEHIITAYEVENILDNDIEVDISGVKHLFSQTIQGQWDKYENRPKGGIDLLIGENVGGLHPIEREIVGHLKIKVSIFGSGHVLSGSHPAIKSQLIKWSKDVQYIRNFAPSSLTPETRNAVVNHVSIKPIREFFEQENMGVEPPRRCGNCMQCKECSSRAHLLSQQEQYEYTVLESNVKYEKETKQIHVSYPFTNDPYLLPDNKSQVIKIAERLEKNLIKTGRLERFNQELEKLIQYGAITELSIEELKSWKGPVHYVSLQVVENENSETTPFRIVSNSSLSNKNGVSLNSFLMKGPNTLSDPWDILTKWRSYEVGMCSDVTKAYYSLHTGETEKHVRRVVWRNGIQDSDWKVFGFCTVSFGDRPAAAFLEIAMKMVAEENRSIDPEAADRIINNRYVDDLASGGNPSQVSRFVGNETEDFQCDGTLPTILSNGSLRLKVIVLSGESNKDKLAKLGEKVLGIGWDATLDKISIDLSVNIAVNSNSKLKKIKLSEDDLPNLKKDWLTKRNILSIVNGVFDPLGLLSPITIRLKAAFRDVFRSDSDLGWDDSITSTTEQKLLLELIGMLVTSNNITFPRATTPPNTVGKSQLVCFFDGSNAAYAGTIYIRWELSDQSVYTALLCSKARITPLLQISTPRCEMNGLVLLMRLLLSALRSLEETNQLPECVWVIGDSECSLACVENVTSVLGEWFGNRVGEVVSSLSKIEKFCPVGMNGELYHTASSNNAADRATRLDSGIVDVIEGSEWQTGPAFLRKPPSEWPINRNFASRKEDHIPQGEILKRYRNLIHLVQTDHQQKSDIASIIDPFYTNYWEKLIRKTELVLKWAFTMPFFQLSHGESTLSAQKSYAKKLWFLTAMSDTREAMQEGKLKELNVVEVDGLLVTIGRAQTGLQKLYGTNSLPVIMNTSRVAELIMLSAHWKDHTGIDITMALSRHEAWIINARKLAKRIVKKCVRCRYLRKLLEGQKMAALPDAIQGPAPPFFNVGIDLCGPLVVKSMTNKRSTMKVWVVILVCLNTKAVCMELAPGYSTDDFLLAYHVHQSRHGVPSYVYSDKGSQLVAAHKELAQDPLKYDWDSIAASATQQGTTWEFTPSGAQWRNGATESFVKKFKRSFYHLYRETRLNYAEMLCAVKRIANILNDRPVSVQRTKTDAQDEDFLHPLTPNMLLLGRSSSQPPVEGHIVNEDNPHVRLSFIDEIEKAWWYQYKVQYFQSLMPTRKWNDKQRNIAVGDVVLIEYSSKSLPGTYRLGRVKEVELDVRDNLVRTCTVVYKLIKPITEKNRDTVADVTTKVVRVPVQRLVLILPVEEQS